MSTTKEKNAVLAMIGANRKAQDLNETIFDNGRIFEMIERA